MQIQSIGLMRSLFLNKYTRLLAVAGVVASLLLVSGISNILSAQAAVTVTLDSNEAGIELVVDGVVVAVPYDLVTDDLSSHDIYAPSPQTTADGRTITFDNWSDTGAQGHTISPTGDVTIVANFVDMAPADPYFQNGFEEGDTSAYPQPNIDIAPGNTLEVTSNNVRTGDYSLEVTNGGVNQPAVIDALLMPLKETAYTEVHFSLPTDYVLPAGAAQNFFVYKTIDFRNNFWVTIDSSYRIGIVNFDSTDSPTFYGAFGPVIPRDGSWHSLQVRYTVDPVHGQAEVWLDDTLIFTEKEIDTGDDGTDDIHVVTLGSYFSTPTITTTMFFDDLTISDTYIDNITEGFVVETIAAGFNIGVYAVATPDGRFFVGEKDGTIRVVDTDGNILPEPLMVIPNVNTFQDRGLLSLALHPDFETNGYLYAAYTYDVDPTDFEGIKTARVSRFIVTGNTADPESEEIILGSQPTTIAMPSCDNYPINSDCLPSDGRTHTVGQIMFMPDGTLLVAQGEGAPDETVNSQAMRSQNLDSLAGKYIRVTDTGEGLPTNPFFTGNVNDNRSKVYAYGMRNAFRFGIRPETGRIYSGDVGWGEWEEINVVVPGGNYGWPCYEGFEENIGYGTYQACQDLYTAGTAVEPAIVWPHPPSSAALGGAFYTGTTYPEHYQGRYFYGDFAANEFWTAEFDENDTLVPGTIEEFPHVTDGPVQAFMGPDDNLHYLSIYTGELRRVVYATDGIPPIVQITASPTNGPLDLTVNFDSTGTFDPDGGALVYDWDFGDGSAHSALANPVHTYTVAGTYTATLTVTDPQGISRSRSLRIDAGNTAPELTIDQPIDGYEYNVGELLTFSASATDAEDGALTSANINHRVVLHHCEVTTQTCHQHPFLQGAGDTGSITAPNHGDGTYLQIFFTATDSQGLATTESIFVYPAKVTITIDSIPQGATVVVNEHVGVTPFTHDVQINGANSLFIPSPQTIGGTEYFFASWDDAGEQAHNFTITEPTTITATLGLSPIQERSWNSWDVTVQGGTPQATVIEDGGSMTANIELYESTNADGVAQGALFPTYVAGAHAEGFNGVATYYRHDTPDFQYPYIGKNQSPRSEAGAPAPSSVLDMQIHPGLGDLLTVAAFVAPEDGNYTVSNLATRRVLGWGDTTEFKVFNSSQTLIATLTATSGTWTVSGTTYDLGTLSAGDKIYFAVDNADGFVGDATEIAWTVTSTTETSPAAVVNAFSAFPTVLYEGGAAVPATLTWETSNADSVEIDNGVGTVALNGSVEVTPAVTTVYTITATNSVGSVQDTVTVTVDPGVPPTVVIDSPIASAEVFGSTVTVNYSISGSALPTGGHLHLTLDSNPHVTIMDMDGDYDFTGVAAGTHTITAHLVNGNHTMLTYPEAMDSVTFTVTTAPEVTDLVWNSWDVEIMAGTPQARVLDEDSQEYANIELYESTNADGVAQGALFPTFVAGAHAEGFNGIATYYRHATPDFQYPYIGKNQTVRAAGEGLAPTGVNDLQIHPGLGDLLTVAAFVAPQDGDYTVSNLAARRVLGWGDTVEFKVFDSSATLIATITADSGAWEVDGATYDLGTLSAGDKIFFAVDNADGFVGDATEIAWTVTMAGEEGEPAPTIDTFSLTPSTITAGGSSTLAWATTNATVVDISPIGAGLTLDGSIVVSPTATRSYTITATGPGGEVEQTITLTVNPVGAPTVDSFSATPATIAEGSSSTLAWTTTGATTVTINNGVGTVVADGSVSVSPAVTTTYTITATNGGGSDVDTVTVTVTPASTSTRIWNSWDVDMAAGTPQATVNDTEEGVTANIEIYTSATAGDVDLGTLMTAFTSGNHSEGFNNLTELWSGTAGGGYPYCGKSASGRGSDAGEAGNAPGPLGVNDLQCHPPQSDNLIVVAFTAPEAGNYTISDLAARRVLPWGDSATLRVFDETGTEIATIVADATSWTVDSSSYDLGALDAGDKIYFAVDRDGSFVGDATEMIWVITKE